MKSIRGFLTDDTFLLKLITTILTLAVLLAISSPLWIWPLAIRVVLAMITGALLTLSINQINKLNEIAEGSLNLVKRSIALIEQTQNTLDSFLAMTNRQVNPESLRKFYLSIQDIYIHFMDDGLINRYYQFINDIPILSKITQESTQSSGTSGSASISVPFGNIIESTGQLKSDYTETEKETIEKVIPEVSIERKVLAWQSSLIHLDKINLGYEYCSWQLTHLEATTQPSSEQSEDIPDTTREIVRLMGINGFILINGSFSITDCDLQSYYELIYRHPINDLEEQANVNFRVRLPKSKIPKHISDNSYFDRTNISVIVFGYVNQNQYDGISTESPTFINVNPIVVYSTPTIFSENKLLATLIEKYSIKNKFLDAREKELETQRNELETKKEKLESVLIAQGKILEAKERDLESQQKDRKTEVTRIKD